MSEQVLTSQWGQEPLTVAKEIPTVALGFLLGRVHVMTPDEDVVAMIAERLDGRRNRRALRYTPEQREQTMAAALWLHHENRAEYIGVMSGRF